MSLETSRRPRVAGFRLALPRALYPDRTDPDALRALPYVSLSLLQEGARAYEEHALSLRSIQELLRTLTETAASAPPVDEAFVLAEITLRLEDGEALYRLSTRHALPLIAALTKALDRLRDEPPLILSPIHLGHVLGWEAEDAMTALHIAIEGAVEEAGMPRRILLDAHHPERRTTTVWLDDDDVNRLDRALEDALAAVATGTPGVTGQLFEGDPARGAPPWLTIRVRDRRSIEILFEEDPAGGEAFRAKTIHLAAGSVKELQRLLREAMLAKSALPEAPAAPEGMIAIEAWVAPL